MKLTSTNHSSGLGSFFSEHSKTRVFLPKDNTQGSPGRSGQPEKKELFTRISGSGGIVAGHCSSGIGFPMRACPEAIAGTRRARFGQEGSKPGTRNVQPTARSAPSGGHGTVEPPGPIPNPEVKHRCADGSGAKGPVRVGRRQFKARLFPRGRSRALFLVPRGILRVTRFREFISGNPRKQPTESYQGCPRQGGAFGVRRESPLCGRWMELAPCGGWPAPFVSVRSFQKRRQPRGPGPPTPKAANPLPQSKSRRRHMKARSLDPQTRPIVWKRNSGA